MGIGSEIVLIFLSPLFEGRASQAKKGTFHIPSSSLFANIQTCGAIAQFELLAIPLKELQIVKSQTSPPLSFGFLPL